MKKIRIACVLLFCFLQLQTLVSFGADWKTVDEFSERNQIFTPRKIIQTSRGTLLVSGTIGARRDPFGANRGGIIRRSEDGGVTWYTVYREDASKGPNGFFQSDVFDVTEEINLPEESKKPFLFASVMTENRLAVLKSEDDGVSWTTFKKFEDFNFIGNLALPEESTISVQHGYFTLTAIYPEFIDLYGSAPNLFVVRNSNGGRNWTEFFRKELGSTGFEEYLHTMDVTKGRIILTLGGYPGKILVSGPKGRGWLENNHWVKESEKKDFFGSNIEKAKFFGTDEKFNVFTLTSIVSWGQGGAIYGSEVGRYSYRSGGLENYEVLSSDFNSDGLARKDLGIDFRSNGDIFVAGTENNKWIVRRANLSRPNQWETSDEVSTSGKNKFASAMAVLTAKNGSVYVVGFKDASQDHEYTRKWLVRKLVQ